MAELDDIIHQPLRLKIMAALNALPATAAGLEFSRLKKLTGATDGNLGAHIETLAKAGYVAVEKAFVGKKPQTTVTATAAGRGAFARHVATLQEIIAASLRQPCSSDLVIPGRHRTRACPSSANIIVQVGNSRLGRREPGSPEVHRRNNLEIRIGALARRPE